MLRGKVTKVTSAGVFVQTADFGTVGPCQAVVANYSVGDMVLMSNVGSDAAPDLVVVGKLTTNSSQLTGVNELLIQAAGNPANGGGGSIRTAGNTYTMVILPRNADATYASGSEFYYDTSVPRWACETNFWVEGKLVARSGTSYGVELGSGGPTITTGTGAPSHSAPNGSVYLRTDGTSTTTLYIRAAGAWVAK